MKKTGGRKSRGTLPLICGNRFDWYNHLMFISSNKCTVRRRKKERYYCIHFQQFCRQEKGRLTTTICNNFVPQLEFSQFLKKKILFKTLTEYINQGQPL